MRQRVIIVPKDKIAEKALDLDEATKEQLIELSITEEEFLFMYQNGVIELINLEGKTNVDDFEDDSVTGKENLSRVIRALNSRVDLNTYNELSQNVSNLFNEAIDRNTGVYFYF